MEVHGADLHCFGRARDHDTSADNKEGNHAANDGSVDTSKSNNYDDCANDYGDNGANDHFS